MKHIRLFRDSMQIFQEEEEEEEEDRNTANFEYQP